MKSLREILLATIVTIGSQFVDWQTKRAQAELLREQDELARLIEREIGLPWGAVTVEFRRCLDGTTLPKVNVRVPLTYAQQTLARVVLESIGKKVRTDFLRSKVVRTAWLN